MKVLIIEDEHLTARRIQSLLKEIDPFVQVLDILDSVKSSVAWFGKNENPDLVFMDIQLADGISFDIFEHVKIDYPIIFITAYQEYAIKAFKVNSVDYLLKPVAKKDLQLALEKYRHYYDKKQRMPLVPEEMLAMVKQMIQKPFKSRFMIRVGDRVKSLEVKDILYFYSLDKGCYLHSSDNRNYVIDFTLDALVDLLDPESFYRINRRYIIAHNAIRDIFSLSGSKLKILLLHSDDDSIYVSRDRMAGFKAWIDR
ncbi:MAG: LytTR family DNA-binding domain-containing protein [Bacteroidota bacterium]